MWLSISPFLLQHRVTWHQRQFCFTYQEKQTQLIPLPEVIAGTDNGSGKHVQLILLFLSTDTQEFVNKCEQNKRFKKLNMTARLLEVTCSIKAENIPDNISTDYITVYFESARNGGGPVSDIQLLPEESAAIITFCDHKGNGCLCLLTKLRKLTPDLVNSFSIN